MNRVMVNFGCGPIQPEDWINVDSDPTYSSFLSLDFFSDDQVDIIACHHVLSDISHHELPKVLKELHRVLKFAGTLRISVPDILAGYTAFCEGNIGWFPNAQNHKNIEEAFCTWLTWYGEHKSAFTYQYLRSMLQAAGFRHITRSEFQESPIPEFNAIETRQYESIFVEAVK